MGRTSNLEAIDWDSFKFKGTRRNSVLRVKAREHFEKFDDYSDVDVVIIGADAAGLIAAWVLLTSRSTLKIVVVEVNKFQRSGGYLGTQLCNPLVVRKPADKLLGAFGISYKDEGDYVVVQHGALFISTLLSRVLELPNIKILHDSRIDKIYFMSEPVEKKVGVVTTWRVLSSYSDTEPRLNSSTIYSKVVIVTADYADSKHPASLASFVNEGRIQATSSYGAPLDPVLSDAVDEIIARTREIYSGLIVAGSQVAKLDEYIPPDPTSDILIMSGIKAADIALLKFDETHKTEK